MNLKTRKNNIIDSAVSKLHEMGMIHCNKKNIFSDPLYASQFGAILRNNKGQSKIGDDIIHNLLDKIQKKKKK